jgi:hypothetical protein
MVQKNFLPQVGANKSKFSSEVFFHFKTNFPKVNTSQIYLLIFITSMHYSVICDDLINKMQIEQKTTIDQIIYIALHKKEACL